MFGKSKEELKKEADKLLKEVEKIEAEEKAKVEAERIAKLKAEADARRKAFEDKIYGSSSDTLTRLIRLIQFLVNNSQDNNDVIITLDNGTHKKYSLKELIEQFNLKDLETLLEKKD